MRRKGDLGAASARGMTALARGSLALLCVAGAACSDSEPEDDEEARCLETAAPPRAADRPEVRYIGTVAVTDAHRFAIGADGLVQEARTGQVRGTFADVQGVGTSTPALFMDLGFRCVGRVSAPGIVSPPLVSAGTLEVDGTTRGALSVPEIATGRYRVSGGPLLDGATGLTVRGTPAAAGFPAFELGIDAAQPLTVDRPLSDGTGAVESDGFRVRWNAGNGQRVVIVVSPISDDPAISGGQVICEVIDDGCFEIPAGAAIFLQASNVMSYNLVVARVITAEAQIGEDAHVELESAAEWRAVLRNAL